MPTISLDDRSLTHVRSALLFDLEEALVVARDQVAELKDAAAPGVIAADARSTCSRVRELINALDRLGWPQPQDQ